MLRLPHESCDDSFLSELINFLATGRSLGSERVGNLRMHGVKLPCDVFYADGPSREASNAITDDVRELRQQLISAAAVKLTVLRQET